MISEVKHLTACIVASCIHSFIYLFFGEIKSLFLYSSQLKITFLKDHMSFLSFLFF